MNECQTWITTGIRHRSREGIEVFIYRERGYNKMDDLITNEELVIAVNQNKIHCIDLITFWRPSETMWYTWRKEMEYQRQFLKVQWMEERGVRRKTLTMVDDIIYRMLYDGFLFRSLYTRCHMCTARKYCINISIV